jgi:heme exporter protein A
MPAVEIRDLAKSYNRRLIFKDLTASVAAGGALVVTGPNGSGKTTLLRILAGLVRPSSGTVTMTIGEARLSPLEARTHLGFVGPDIALYYELTALENLAFFARVRGLALSQKELLALLERVGLAGRSDDRVSAYSSGMRQRLRYAYALMHRPPILLLDEPSMNLDEAGIAMLHQVIAEQRSNGLLILATNAPEEVTYGDQVLRLGA